ncbi:MAG: cysteine methyltransferase [Crocinitomicaceae bacterium]|jgi:methylated-DNA-protein-cysteine methyltransferase-like protein|nr:cysteine methyltransferase [Crocinitomicaceae bacterium]
MATIKLSEKNKDFFENVYAVVREIPEGRVTSYGAIAAFLGAKRSSRMVGWAMHGAGSMPEVPAHRVVNRNGYLTGKGHFNDPDEMELKLKAEGIQVTDDRVVDFNVVFWDPATALSL